MQKRVSPASALSGAISLPGDKSISHRYAMIAAIAEGRLQLPGEPGKIDDHLANAGARERLQMPLDQRTPAHLHERLRQGIGERAHALAAPGCEQHRLHRCFLAG